MKMLPLLRRLDAWAGRWTLSQVVFMMVIAALFTAALAWQAHVIRVLSTQSFVYLP